MQLIKISPSKVSIHTDSTQMGDIKINDLLLLSDNTTSIVCTVTGITGQETFNFDDDLTYNENEIFVNAEKSNIIEASIIGSVIDGKFVKSINNYPTINVSIKQIDDDFFTNMIAVNQKSAFRLGEYSTYKKEACIDGNKFFQRHSCIVGNTGSGKSYCVSSILQKMSKLQSANVILFDLHGEYKNLSFVKSISIGNNGLQFPFWFLSFKDIYSFFLKIKEETSTSQIAALRKAFYKARESNASENLPLSFSLEMLIERIKEMNNEVFATGEYYKTGEKAGMQKTVKGDNNGKLTPVLALLEDKKIDTRYKFMTAYCPQEFIYDFINEIYDNQDKRVKVIDLSDIPHDMVPITVAVITKLIYQVQLQQNRNDISPINIICEEAHAYIPASDFGLSASQRRLLDVFETISKEGRKFGTTLTVISQRPSELNKTITAQCENYIVLKMANETDKRFVKSILPESNRSVIDMLSLFSPGDCFTIGDASNILFKIHIDKPEEAPISNTIDVWDYWGETRETDVDALVDNLLKREAD